MRKRKRSLPDRRHQRLRPGRLARAGRQTLCSVKVGALPIIHRILKRLRLEEFLQEHLPLEDTRYVKHVSTRFDLSYQIDHGRIAAHEPLVR